MSQGGGGYDPWASAPVWFSESAEAIWRAGVVKRHEVVDKTRHQWRFFIETPQKREEDEEEGEEVLEEVEVVSEAVDSFNLEFLDVKKRDKSVEHMSSITDMTSLAFLNEPEMIECLRQRYHKENIYTNIGPILIAVNPFKLLGDTVYSNDVIAKYFNCDQNQAKAMGPHTYGIAHGAYMRMFIDKFDPDKRENQSILVNGESGAGKTESTKQVLRYLGVNSTTLASSLDNNSVRDIDKLVNSVNPITESFGNAKTSRNNNSSRFGKFIELNYTADGYIGGAYIQTYLLETIRVTSQLHGERNYHIFYEIFASLNDEQKERYKCPSLDYFKYLNQSGEYNRHDGEDDFKNFEKLCLAMDTIDLSPEQIESVIKVVVAILHIGNLTFDLSTTIGEDAAVFSVESRVHVESICYLLGIEESFLLNAVAKRSIRVAGNSIQKNLNVEGAVAARDVYAKTTYDLLFRNMLKEFNKSLSLTNCDDDEETVSFIGVLDIFGFEYFAKNSFEQLCINYANEKLQDHFNYAIFKSEREVYEDEGIKWTFTDYPDNSERLELFEHRSTGLFLLCDEQLKIPKPSDEKLVKSFYAKCQSYRYFEASRSEQVRMEFVVCHFACDVRYEITGFVEKNRNEIGQEIFDSYENSKNDVILQLPALSDHHAAKKSDHAGETPRKKSNFSHVGKKTSSLASQFSKQLSDLILKIRSTRSHFIRCIKPNNVLQSDNFNYNMMMNQLRCGGALGAVQVFHAGFPNRMDFQFFVRKYSAFLVICGANSLTKDLQACITRARQIGADDLWRTSSSMLIDIVSLTMIVLNIIDESEIAEEVDVFGGLQMGNTQVFMRAPVFEYLERLHARTIIAIAKRLQRRYRQRVLERKSKTGAALAAANAIMSIAHGRRGKARQCVSATLLLQRRVRVFLATRWRKGTVRSFTRLKAHFRGYKARARVRAMKFRAATKVQKVFRCHKAQRKYLQLRKTTIFVQAIVRGFQARYTKFKKLKLILTLQCLWRGTLARIETFVYRQKLKQQALETQRRAEEAKANFMTNLDDKLKSNPNLLFDMLGASDKIALLSRQNEALMQSNKLLESENAELRDKISNSVEQFVLEEMEISHQLQLEEELQKQQDMFESSGLSVMGSGNVTPSASPRSSFTMPRPTSVVRDKDDKYDGNEGGIIDVTVCTDEDDFISTQSSVNPGTTSEQSLSSENVDMDNNIPLQATPRRSRVLSGTGASLFPATPNALPIDYHHRILALAREGVRKLGFVYDKKIEERESLLSDMSKVKEEIDSLKDSLSNLQTKLSKESERLHHLKKEQECRAGERAQKSQTPPQSPSQTTGGVSPSVASSDPKAQAAYLTLQLQTLRKRKITTETLIATLEADKDQYSLEDVQATQTMLSGISSKIEELENQLNSLPKSSPVKSPPPPPPPSQQSQSTHSSFTPGFTASFASVSGLASSMANVTANSVKRLGLGSSSQASPSKNNGEVNRPFLHATDIDAKCDASSSKISHLEQEIHILEETVGVKKERIQEIQDEYSLFEIDESNAAALRQMKEVVLFLSDEGGDHSTLVPEVDAQWKVKDLIQKNAALTDELQKVKGRFSSVLGTMDNFSLSNFRVNQVSEKAPASEGTVSKQKDDQSGGKKMSVTAPLSVQAAKQQELARMAQSWSPNFIGSVNTWSRQGRECIFIISVRAVGERVAEWTVMKTFNEFKALKAILKSYSAAIDSSFPGDYFSFFSLSDDAAEDRMEALNTYLLSVCGCQSIMTSEQGCIAVKSFLRIDENLGKRRR